MRSFFCLLSGLLLVIGAGIAGANEDSGRVMVIDDFQSPGQSSLGTQWQGFTDRVMGGVSTMQAGYRQTDDGTVLSMRGSVSLANNGGFIQVRLPLGDNRALDATNYDGVAIEARGTAGHYFVHIRTRQTRAPWQYYAADIPVVDDWQRTVIPFSAFEGASIRRDIDRSELVSIAIVGGEYEFDAAIDIRRLELITTSGN